MHRRRLTPVAWFAVAMLLPAAAVAARSPRSPILPPHNPQSSLAVERYVPTVCAGPSDSRPSCLEASLALINAGRLSEQLGPVMLPVNWEQLTVPEQLFVLSELERTARGQPPDSGLAADWNQAAQSGADAGQDPIKGGSGAHGFEAIWAGGEPSPIVVVADWMYGDGIFPNGTSENLDCSANHIAGCWSHRDILLHDTSAAACGSRCAVGAAYSAAGFAGGTGGGFGHASYAEIFSVYGANNPDPLMFTWAAERKQLPACELVGDSCSWAGIPIATAAGIRKVGNASAATSPWFSVRIQTRHGAAGQVSLLIHPVVRLVGVSVVARLGGQQRRLTVRRSPHYGYSATATLTPGVWTVTIRYRMSRRPGYRPASVMQVTVPSA
jgi:hypothetical protein